MIYLKPLNGLKLWFITLFSLPVSSKNVRLNVITAKRVETSQVSTDIKLNWQLIQCHLHNLLPFFYSFVNMDKEHSLSFHPK